MRRSRTSSARRLLVGLAALLVACGGAREAANAPEGPAASRHPSDGSTVPGAAAFAAGSFEGAKGEVMIDIQHQVSLLPPQPLAVAGTPIQRGAATAAPRAQPPRGGCSRLFCGPEQSSRLPGPVLAGKWRVKWRVPIDPDVRPTTVVQGQGRVIVSGGGSWQLVDLAGAPLAQGRLGPSGVIVDEANGLFYTLSPHGVLSALRLADGAESFNTDVHYGDLFVRPFIARRGRRLLEVGVEAEGGPHRPAPPDRSVIHAVELPDAPLLDGVRTVENLVADEALLVGTTSLVVAMRDDTLVFAVPGRIYHATPDLKPTLALEADFVPRMLSLDERDHAHLIVERKKGLSLWVVRPDARITVATYLKPEYATLVAPPVIGLDHRIFLVAPGSVMALHGDGTTQWERAAKSTIVGAAVSADDQLVVSAGDELAAYAPTGDRWTLAALGEPLLTPPAMSAAGELLVASASFLYCLAA